MIEHPDITAIQRTGYPRWCPDAEPTMFCDNCGAELMRGDKFYRVHNECFCVDCMEGWEDVVE